MTTSTKALALLLCIHSAAGLQCWSCSDPSCSSVTEETCSSEKTKCRSMAYKGTPDVIYKGCISPSQCPPHNGLYSFNFDLMKDVCNITCCDSDLCNPVDMSPPVTPPAGSLQCNACNTGTNQCNTIVTCNTLETVCFEGEVEDSGAIYGVAGCGSENVLNTSSVNLPPNFINSKGFLVRATPITGTATTTTTTTTAAPTTTTTTAAPTTTTTAAPTTTTTAAPTTTTAAAPTTTTTTAAPTTTTTAAPTTTTTAAPTTTTTAAPTTTAPNPSSSAPPGGSLQCFHCDSTDCSVTVTCDPLEACFERTHASGQRSYGCASENMCRNTGLAQPNITCCNTSYCNRPRSATTVPPTTTVTPPTTTDPDDDGDDDSLFCAARRVLPAALLLTLLQLYVYTEHF